MRHRVLRRTHLLTAAIAASSLLLVASPPAAAAAPEVLVGVGSDTTEGVLKALASAYNTSSRNVDRDRVFSIPATGEPNDAPGDSRCPAGVSYGPNGQPDGSSAGITALITQPSPAKSCIDFARSSRARRATDGPTVFRAFALDAVTWAAFSGGNAPSNLSKAALQRIYTCAARNWNQVGGRAGTIVPYLPQEGSGTRAFFLDVLLDGKAPGSCVRSGIQENTGAAVPAATRPNAILPYSVAKWTAQKNGVIPNTRAGAFLGRLNGVAATPTTIANQTFPATRYVYNVTRTDAPATVKTKLDRLFSPSGYLCTDPTAKALIQRHGFVLPPLGKCGRDNG